MNEWEFRTVAEIAAPTKSALATGPFGSAIGAKTFRNQGVPVLRGGNLSSDVEVRLNDDDLVFIEPGLADTFQRSTAKHGDLIFTCWGTTNQVGFIDERAKYPEYIVSNKQMKLTSDRSKVVPLFLYYYFSSPQGQTEIAGQAIGSSVPGFNLGGLRSIRVPVPSIPVQTKMAELLGALDDKIELNRRINETLEETARAIFRDWFVDFGPTRAKMEGGEPYLSPHLWALFPHMLDADGKPEGWLYEELGTVTSELRRGISPSYTESGGVRVLNQKCVRGRRIDPSVSRRHNPEHRAVNGRELKSGDILVNSTGVGTLGRTAQLWEVEELTVVDSHVTVARPDTAQISVYYLGLDLTGREAEIEALGEGSTGQTELARTRLAALPVLVPASAVQAIFDELVRPILSRVSGNESENRILADLRDSLLPKLMSGEIRLRDAEKLVGAAA